ncbi:MAG: MCE family protein [Saprospiraceae bacterium]|nr:MCE family protein [Saprospiraceae bacterium]
MSKEFKIGVMAIVALAFLIWGYFFLKGRNLLTTSRTFYVEYPDVDQLNISSPVFINGFQIGVVSSINLKENDFRKVIVAFNVDKDINIPKDAVVQIIPNGLMGGKAINLKINRICSGDDCAKSGDHLRGEVVNILDAMIGEEKLDQYMGSLGSGVGDIVDSLSYKLSHDKNKGVGKSLHNIDIVIANLRSITAKLDVMMNSSPKQINAILADVKKLTGALGNSQMNVSNIMSNTDSITRQLKNANVGNTIGKANKMLDETTTTVSDMKQSVAKLDKSLGELSQVLQKMNSEQGTLGKLINDKKLYVDLDNTLKQTQLLLQDIRLNPKRYVNVSVFGKKQKTYDYPEDDPANVIFKDTLN